MQESKDNTVALLEQYARNGKFAEPPADVSGDRFDVTYLSGSQEDCRQTPVQALAALLAELKEGDYNAITAYIARNQTHEDLCASCA